MFGQRGDFPCLHTKAAETQHVLPVVLSMCREQNNNIVHHKMRIWALESLDSFYSCIFRAGRFLSDDEANSCKQHVEEFLLAYNWLVCFRRDKAQMVYNFTTKMRFLWHMADLAKFLSPKLVWCYEFEDYVGTIKRSALAAMPGSSLQKIGRKVIDNTLFVMFLLLRRRETNFPV